jgi:hypothetical protein
MSQLTRCRGTSRRTGNPCKAWASIGSSYCKVHGGHAPKGIMNPNYKTGKYSKFLPKRLQQRYVEAFNDDNLLENRESLAIMDARLQDVLKRVDTGEAGKLWSNLKQTYKDLRYAMRIQDAVATAEKLGELDTLISRGMADYAAWGEVYKVLELRKGLAESERKRLVEMNQMITAERAMLLVSAIMGAIKKHVLDKVTLGRVMLEIRRLVNVPGEEPNNADEIRAKFRQQSQDMEQSMEQKLAETQVYIEQDQEND